mmetsp:Transcript_164259/g.315548  ORF Transcript_164259/g.315548 Transcript_164259/m.315548 type:complete len:221 (-) Transcript_164259:2-664(-)
MWSRHGKLMRVVWSKSHSINSTMKRASANDTVRLPIHDDDSRVRTTGDHRQKARRRFSRKSDAHQASRTISERLQSLLKPGASGRHVVHGDLNIWLAAAALTHGKERSVARYAAGRQPLYTVSRDEKVGLPGIYVPEDNVAPGRMHKVVASIITEKRRVPESRATMGAKDMRNLSCHHWLSCHDDAAQKQQAGPPQRGRGLRGCFQFATSGPSSDAFDPP